jgi:hypothetical protein
MEGRNNIVEIERNILNLINDTGDKLFTGVNNTGNKLY